MKKTRIAINGFGRIGRAFFKTALAEESIEIAAINDLGDVENLAYLLKYDSAYGPSGIAISVESGALVVEGKKIPVFAEREPVKLPWGDLGIDVVIESTGIFETYEKAQAHIEAGAKRVVVTAPMKDEPGNIAGATVLMGVNDGKLKEAVITSNASCTTNAGSPVIAILDESIGLESVLINTVHAYTATQELVDGASKGDFRRGRAAAHNIVPSSTGAARATTKALTNLEGKLDGIAIRVPVISGSLIDVTFVSKRPTSAEEINSILKKAATEERWKDIFTVTEDSLVSTDIVGNHHASIADLEFTRVVGGNLGKVLAWYDNEMGYAYTLLKHVKEAGKYA